MSSEFRFAGFMIDNVFWRNVRITELDPNGHFLRYGLEANDFPTYTAAQSENYVYLDRFGPYSAQLWEVAYPPQGASESQMTLQLSWPGEQARMLDASAPSLLPTMQPAAATPRQSWRFFHQIEIFVDPLLFSPVAGLNPLDYIRCLTVVDSATSPGKSDVRLAPWQRRPISQLWSYIPVSKEITAGGTLWLTGDPTTGSVTLEKTRSNDSTQKWLFDDTQQIIGPGGRALTTVDGGETIALGGPDGNRWWARGTLNDKLGNYLVPEPRDTSVFVRSPRDNETAKDAHRWPPVPEKDDAPLFRLWPTISPF